jgi:ribosomal protein S18 acetylase RimI-like enzyme
MTLSPKIAAALDGPDAGALPCDLVIEDDAHHLVLHLTASGPVGLAFGSLDFKSTAGRDSTPASLKTWGDRIAARVTYLMEPLVVLEQDRLAGEVEIRSHAPTIRGDNRAFYTIRIGAEGTLHLARTAFDESTRRRRPIDCMMTREVLERLVDDVIACIP